MFNEKAYSKAYWQKNKATLSKKQRKYRKANLEKILPMVRAGVKTWRKNNPEKVKLYNKISRQRVLGIKRAYRQAHPELYYQDKIGRWRRLPKYTADETHKRKRVQNAIYQKTRGREVHNKAAREYQRRKRALAKLQQTNI